jgi:hypothetical protein
LVLLRGVLADSRVWNRQLAYLSDQFTVIAWDAPGAGQSADSPEPFVMADCLAVLLDAIGIDKAHIIGLSWWRADVIALARCPGRGHNAEDILTQAEVTNAMDPVG